MREGSDALHGVARALTGGAVKAPHLGALIGSGPRSNSGPPHGGASLWHGPVLG